MRFVVTGGAGFIGRALVSRLVEIGDVTVVDSGETGRLDLLPPSVLVLNRDISAITENSWSDIADGAEAVFHLAAQKHNTPGVTYDRLVRTNIDATWRIAQASARCNVGKFVFASSLYAYGYMGPALMRETDVPRPSTLYGMTKLAGEGLVATARRQYGLRGLSLRLFFVYGPGQFADGGYKSIIVKNFERLHVDQPPTICGDGQQSLDYVYLDDAVDALISAASSPTEETVLNISSGRTTSVAELVALMMQTVDKSLAPTMLPSDWTAGSTRGGDPTLAMRELDWSVRTPLLEGLRMTWDSLTS